MTTTEPPTPEPEDQEAAEEAAEDHETDDASTPAREAARYRVRAREAEEAAAAAASALESSRRAHVEALLVADGRVTSEAFWYAGAPDGIDGLLDDTGTVNAEKVAEAIGRAGKSLGLTMSRRPAVDPNQGDRAEPGPQPPTWAEVLGTR